MIQYLKLGSLTRIRTGKLDANAADDNGKYPFFTCSKEPLSINTCSYDCECVLVAGNGDLNVKYYDGKFDAYQRTYIIESLDKTKLMVKYLYCFLDLYVEILRQQAIGGVIKYIKLGNLADAIIPVPVIEKQREIIEIIEKCNGTIAYRHQELLLMDQLVKSRFIEMFGDPVTNLKGWTTKPLLDMGNCKNGMNFHTGDSGMEMHCLGVGDFKDLSFIDGTDHLPVISLNEAPPEESMLRDGDIVFVRSNGNKALVGRCLVVYPRSTPTTYSGFCIRYRLTSSEVDTTYLLRVLKTDSMRKKMAGLGANIQNLNQQILAALDIPLPPIKLQQAFAAFVEQVDKSKFEIQQSLEKLEILKKSLMQQYFG